jgi:hypothetical protein
MKCLPVAAMFILLSAASALAEGRRTVTLGSLSLTYDTSLWRSEQTDEGFVGMFPVGRLGGKLHRVYLLQIRNASGKSCAEMALRELSSSTYDEPQRRVIKIGGAEALRLTASAHCANALPKAVVICVRQGDEAYLVKASRPGCGSGANTLNSGIDPLDGLVSGLRLSP